MLTKLTAKNQITLPTAIVRRIPAARYFDATCIDGVIVLQPVKVVPLVELKQLRRRLRRAGVRPGEVGRAVRWARRSE
jgi:hypothetical protein